MCYLNRLKKRLKCGNAPAFAIIMNKFKFFMRKRKNAKKPPADISSAGGIIYSRLIKKFINYILNYRTVFNVGSGGSEAKRGIDNAPPVVARARAKLYDKRVVHAVFKG